MNEVRALVEAFDEAIGRGEQCALATIVSIEGSSYRRPGAKMLVLANGLSTGTLSAGCLENDVIERAKQVIQAGVAKLIEYDTASTSDEMAWGIGLGCNGIVRVLIEPVVAGSLYMEELRASSRLWSDAGPITVATVYAIISDKSIASLPSIGSRLVIFEHGTIQSEGSLGNFPDSIEDGVRDFVLGDGMFGSITVEIEGVRVSVFVEKLLQPVSLIIFGAGPDAVPIVELARRLGWQTEIVDPQARPISLSRFASADRVTLARPEDVGEVVTITSRTMTLLMSHNYAYDTTILKFLLESPASYIGIMGPRKRTERMLTELKASGGKSICNTANLERLYSPVGLDLGADGPAEIALSIVAEIRAVLNVREGGMLSKRRGSIHGEIHERLENSIDKPGRREQRKNLQAETLKVGVRSGMVGAIILAAGSSSRMGRPKQGLLFRGSSLLRQSVTSAIDGGCSPVVVVTGANAEFSTRELAGLDIREIWNPDWETGMGSSVRAGLEELLAASPDVAAAVLLVCDQPYIDAEVVSRLVAAYRVTNNLVIASSYGGTFGVPALFREPLFPELFQLKGKAGAKGIIERYESETLFREFPGGEIDIDTADDLSQMLSNEFANESRQGVISVLESNNHVAG